MPGSNGADDYHCQYSSPRSSPALSTIQLPNHSSNATPFSSNSGFSDLRDMTSLPFSATTNSASLWQDKTDIFSNRQQNFSTGSYMPGEEGSSSTPTTPVLYRKDDGRLGHDEIYIPGRTPQGLTRDLYPPRFLVRVDLARHSYVFSCCDGILLLQNSTTNSIPPFQIITNATHDQLRQSGNLAYMQLYNAFTRAQSEADTIR